MDMALAAEDDDGEDGSDGSDYHLHLPSGLPLVELLRLTSSTSGSRWNLIQSPDSFPPPPPSLFNEPESPHITCLGQIRVSYPHFRSSPPASSPSFKPPKPRLQRRHSIVTNQIPQHIIQMRPKFCWRFSLSPSLSSSCCSRHQQQQLVEEKEPKTAEITRRERLAILLHDLRSALKTGSADDQFYVPPVPPPNSLLLMRGFRRPVPVEVYADFGGDENIVLQANREANNGRRIRSLCDGNGGKIFSSVSDGNGGGKILSSVSDGDGGKPFSNMTNYTSTPDGTTISEPKAPLWERRSIPKLARIDVKRNVV